MFCLGTRKLRSVASFEDPVSLMALWTGNCLRIVSLRERKKLSAFIDAGRDGYKPHQAVLRLARFVLLCK